MTTRARINGRKDTTSRLAITVEEAGQLLGIGRGLAYEMVRQGQIPSLRLGRRVVVPVAGLERLLAAAAPNARSTLTATTRPPTAA